MGYYHNSFFFPIFSLVICLFQWSTAVSSSILQLYTCDTSNTQQQFQFLPIGSDNEIQVVTVGSSPSLCVALVNCSAPIQNEAEVTLDLCNNTRCDRNNTNQRWKFNSNEGYLSSSLSSYPNEMCLTLAAITGPTVNMWPCTNGGNSSKWKFIPSVSNATGSLQTLEPLDNNQCLQRSPSPYETIIVNGSIVGRIFDGIGGLAAVGGARLLYEYPEPYRSDILDLIFSPYVGANYHVLKTEIEGNIDSSYGSAPAYRLSADPNSVSFNRGIYLPWLIQEARKRNPDIILYSLSWGMPGYTESYYSEAGLDYHVEYLQGALSVWNTTFDYTGVWNERPFNRSWVKQLRQSLDANPGLQGTKIVVNDQADEGGCADCPPAWGNSLHAALENDPDFRNAVSVVGFHSADVEGLSPFDAPWESYGLKYWQSESNVADGPMPQWEPNEGNSYGTGLSWPRVFIANYIRARATTTVLCPITHSFTWNYGRENHGHCEIVEPWSGYYELGSGFWSQAQFTQHTAPGWSFLDGQGSNQFCSASGDESCYLLWATLVSPDLDNFSLILVNTQDTSLPNLNVTLQFVDGNFASFYGKTLQVWQTVEDNYYFNVPGGITMDNQGYLNISLPSRSVTTVTSLTTGSHTVRTIPNRQEFPLPFANTFDQQKLEEPGRLLSDLWGAFYVMKDPSNSSSSNQVLYQAVSINPQATSWMGTGVPFTSLPAGTNWVNTNTSIQFYLSSTEINLTQANYVYFCGRVPIWQPANFQKTYAVGICLTINYNLGNHSWSWLLNGNTFQESILYGEGLIDGVPVLDTWHTLQLRFDDDKVTATFDSTVLMTTNNLVYSAGVVGLGTGWTNVYFDNLLLESNSQHPHYNSSYLYDILPGETVHNNVTGWMGMAIDLTVRPVCLPSPGTVQQSIMVTNLGRFKTVNNTGTHLMDIRKASTGESILPNQQPVPLLMENCVSDLLGFCYTAPFSTPVTLPVGDVYYIVAYETANTDSFRELVNAAKMTIHASGRRDGTTYMSYKGPQYGCVAGRVYQYEGQNTFTVIPEFDTSYGPVNMLVV